MIGEIKKVHFIGIGGAGMNGIAEIFINMGYKVTGSDIKNTENTRRIKRLGGNVFIGHDEKNIKGADIVVYSNAVPETNPEITAAKELKIPVLPRAVMLDEIMRLKYGIAIAGSHGKTTTTSMLGKIFEEAKLDPTYIVGGVVKSGAGHARAGKGKFVIAEACEAYGSFLHLNPVIAAVANIDDDHMDYYKKMDALKEAFTNFINKVPFYGAVYLNGDDKNIKSILDDIFVRQVFFGMGRKNDIYASKIRIKNFIQFFDVTARGEKLGTFEIKVPGRHNILNALLAISIALDNGIRVAVIKKALKKFKNVKRRFDVYRLKNFILVDDYAHHPVEIRKVIETGREMTDKKVIAVFQPHLYSRTAGLYKEFAGALSGADMVILDRIYPAREKPMPGVTSELISDRMKQKGYKRVWPEKNRKEMLEKIKKTVKKGDVVLLMGAGDITEFRKDIEREFK